MKNLKPLNNVHREWFKEWLDGSTHEEIAEKNGVTIDAVHKAASRGRWAIRRDAMRSAAYDDFALALKGTYQTLAEGLIENSVEVLAQAKREKRLLTKDESNQINATLANIHRVVQDTEAAKGNIPDLPPELVGVVQFAMPAETAEALGMFSKKRKPRIITDVEYEDIKTKAKSDETDKTED